MQKPNDLVRIRSANQHSPLCPLPLDASGVEMLDVVLGPYRRPTKYGFKHRNKKTK